jgi:hypothetical protein
MAGSTEVRIFAEGSLRWVRASASGGAWATASAAPSSNGPVGYVQAGMAAPSAQRILTVMERGNPSHQKHQGRDAGEISLTFLEAITANDPALNLATAGGASLPLMHFELKCKAPEDASALYYQFLHCALVSNNWSEAEEGNQRVQTWRYLSYVGPTASGYLSTALA